VSSVLIVRPGVLLTVDNGNRRIQEWTADGKCVHEMHVSSMFLDRAWMTSRGPVIRAQGASRSSILLMALRDFGQPLQQILDLPITADGVSSTCVYCHMVVASDGSVYSYVFNDTLYRVVRFDPTGASRTALERVGVPLVPFVQSEKDSIVKFRHWLVTQERTEELRSILAKIAANTPIKDVKNRFRFAPILSEPLNLLLVPQSSAYGRPN